jgi:WD40 repeat protein
MSCTISEEDKAMKLRYWIQLLLGLIIYLLAITAVGDHRFAPFGSLFNVAVGIPPGDALAEPTPTPQIPVLSQIAEIGMPAEHLIFSPDDQLLVLNSWAEGGARVVQVRDTETWKLRWETPPGAWAQASALSPNGQQLAAVISQTTCLCEAATGKPMAQLHYHGEAVYRVAFSPDGEWLVGTGPGGEMLLWEAATQQLVAEFKHDLPVVHFMLSPKGPWLAAMTAGSWGPVELVVWDIFTQERRTLVDLKELPNFSNVVFSPDTKWLAASTGYGSPVTIWETKTWPEVARLEKPPGLILQLAFSPDSRWLAGVVFNDETSNTVVIWEAPGWRMVSQMEMADGIHTIVFSPDSRWLAAGLGQGIEHPPAYEGQLWEVASGKLVARMPHLHQVQAVTFSHNGQWIATGSVDRTVRVWATP